MVLQDKRDHDKCYGCYACYNACPQDCIHMEKDDEGFVYPVIDTQACTQCGLCDKACIIGKTSCDIRQVFLQKPECYYGYATDETVRKRSTSGGMAYVLSAQVIQEGGTVFGVVGPWLESVTHARAQTPEQLLAFCGPKYLQSDVNTTYRQVKEDLKRGQQVLFTGVPCQIAGLHQFLRKEYDNLLTCELLCKGVPSPLALHACVSALQRERGKPIVAYERDKTFQYHPYQYIVRYADGSYEMQLCKDSLFRKGFSSSLFQRKTCTSCAFAAIPRVGDITLGDMFYMSSEEFAKADPKNIGLSLIISNTPAGSAWMRKVAGDMVYVPYPLEEVMAKSANLSASEQKNPLRNLFFHVFKAKGFDKTRWIIDFSFNYQKGRRVLRRWWRKALGK